MSGPEHNPPTGADPLVLLGWADTTQLLDQALHAKPQSDALPLYVPASMMPRVREVQAGLNESLAQMPQLEPVELAQPQAASPEDMTVYNSIAAGYPAQPQGAGEAVYQCQSSDGRWMDLNKVAHDEYVKLGGGPVRVLYTTPPASQQAAHGPWYAGYPPFPQDQEWFIAETKYGDRVVLRSLDEGREHKGSYAFKTADDTYMKAEIVARWMQFPDCDYLPPDSQQAAPTPPNQCNTCGAQPASQQAAQAAPEDVRKNAERYRWLRQSPLANNVALACHFGGSRLQDFDAAIDDAMLRAAKGDAP